MTELRNNWKPDVNLELSRLKDFQRNTVEYVHERLWADDSTGRFLVADEVGLGKTLIGRGVVARAVDYLWDTPQGQRIDIVYICSNGQIARQNLRRLNVADYSIVEVGRLSMLPLVVGKMRDSRVNILSLTPGTSMDVSHGTGQVRERALLHHLLALGLKNKDVLKQEGWNRFFRGAVGEGNYAWTRGAMEFDAVDKNFATEYVSQLRTASFSPGKSAAATSLTTNVFDAANAVRRSIANTTLPGRHGVPQYWQDVWWRLIGRMRHLVAKAAVALLDPDLVILDEFQRFRKYLRDDIDENDPDSDAIELSRAIFEHRSMVPTTGEASRRVRVLLLSATPFVMFSEPGEARGTSHEDDFLLTTTFLSDAATARSIQVRQRIVRDAALGHGDIEEAKAAARQVEKDLRWVMCRTERLAQSTDRNGMLESIPIPLVIPEIADIGALRAASRLGAVVGAGQGMFEFWRAAPYLASFMENYQLKNRINHTLQTDPTPEFIRALAADGLQLPWAQMSRYDKIDLGNAKLRQLWSDLAKQHAPEVPWIPASMPYYEHHARFADAAEAGLTKRLVFSAWAVAPRAIAMLLSYCTEQLSSSESEYRREYSRTALPWSRSSKTGRAGSMPLFATIYPAVELARIGDPLRLAAALGHLPARRDEVLRRVREAITARLDEFPAGENSGEPDPRWYWAVPLALDLVTDRQTFEAYLDTEAERAVQRRGEDLYLDHIAEARAISLEWVATLGPRPPKLIDDLVQLAVAGPGVCALRALGRAMRSTDLDDAALRAEAQAVAIAFRAFANTPAIAQLIGSQNPGLSYRRALLATCLDGNLQALLDEYVHVLIESQGLQGKGDAVRQAVLRACLVDALSQRVGTPQADLYVPVDESMERKPESIRTHFAARFGRERTSEKVEQTESGIRDAFNSPFWPFVLATTSVGQEGLDFHNYCHAVVHWNLPTNPVDLEQREGRVHRYKGHAVRKNVAAKHQHAAIADGVRDPWESVFAAAREEAKSEGLDEITPYWVYTIEGGAQIQRHVLANPLSSETARLDSLLRMVTAYRLTIGQPRQQDLADQIGDPNEFKWMALDLAPRQVR
jgi:hypothetical protein